VCSVCDLSSLSSRLGANQRETDKELLHVRNAKEYYYSQHQSIQQLRHCPNLGLRFGYQFSKTTFENGDFSQAAVLRQGSRDALQGANNDRRLGRCLSAEASKAGG